MGKTWLVKLPTSCKRAGEAQYWIVVDCETDRDAIRKVLSEPGRAQVVKGQTPSAKEISVNDAGCGLLMQTLNISL